MQDDKKECIIKFVAPINQQTVSNLMSTILAKLNEGVERFIVLISSPGGNVASGLTGYNFLKGIPAEVITHNFGSADSIATVLFCAGHKRYCVPNARFLLHGIGFDVKEPTRFTESLLDERIKGIRLDRENISQVIADNSEKSLEDVEQDILQSRALSSQQAIEYGLAHEIKVELFEEGAEVIAITS